MPGPVLGNWDGAAIEYPQGAYSPATDQTHASDVRMEGAERKVQKQIQIQRASGLR